MTYTIDALEAELPGPEMNDLVTEILASSLKSLGLFSDGTQRIADLSLEKQPAPHYERWLGSSVRFLQQQDLLSDDLTFRRDVRALAELWNEWDVLRSAWATKPDQQAQSMLLETCLHALPGILSGKQRATDVMFPNSSMHLVESIYRDNPQANYFNDVLGAALRACIDQQLHVDPERKIRLLEIGAGTGGTTATLLPVLQQYPVEEYCYTDLSKAFLMYGEKQFKPQCPVLTTAIFDVSKPLETQSIAANHYDFVIAANVLHATSNMRETLRTAKAALKNQGVLLLNEIAAWSSFNHLTFGLLEGWWLYEDTAIRLPGSPGLSPDKWREILAQEGFESIGFPAREAHQLGQQIVTAVSNGWTRQRIVTRVPPRQEVAAPRSLRPAESLSPPSDLTEQMIADHTLRIVTAKLAEALRMDPATIRVDASFADFGVDSIVGVNVVRTISEALQIELETTSLFEYSTVEHLSAYILKNWREQIAAQLPRVESVSRTHTAAPSAEVTEQRIADHIRQIVSTNLSEALRMDAAMIRDDASFADYGVDSIVGVNLVRTISEALQIELETTSLFEYSTVEQLAGYILKNWREPIAAQVAQAHGIVQNAEAEQAAEAETRSVQRFPRATRFAKVRGAFDVAEDSRNAGADPIAIIGMSGRFAESESLEAFWQHLAQGHDLVKPVTRWNPADCAMSESAQSHCSHGSWVDTIDQFDPAFFGISSLEATYMDPQQRLFLTESWRALEDAGYAGKGVSEKQCGVYVGCGSSHYDQLTAGETPAQAFWGNSQAVTPARIAYILDLQGPAIAIDTACSSSLVAIHLACQGLWSRETEMALAGGVFLQPTPGFYQVANRAAMLSRDGKCYSFDARANGFVPGEGVGVVVLKRLRDALADGDHIHGVIAASGINQDGRSNGLIAPNGRAQERLERSVYDRFKITPETIQVVEAHGTGTLLGDSIEYGAISRAFRKYTDKKQFCALGTVKTNIGHTSTAAGVAGVLKLLLSLKHRQIPPSLHFETGNPAIDFESSPFYVNTQLKEWSVEGDELRRAAVSSFGFSGTNAHLILEEAPAAERAGVESPAYLVVLSARTAEQLKQQVVHLLEHLKRTPGLSMMDLSFSLFVGRMHFAHRLSCVARDQDELMRLLRQWGETGAASQVYTGDNPGREQVSLKKFGNHCIQECRDEHDAAAYHENLAAVAELYVQGYSLDYPMLFSRDARRIPLPTYPFATERYWVETTEVRPRRSTAKTSAPRRLALRPHTPNVSRQSHGSGFTGADGDLRSWLQNELSQMVVEALNIPARDVAPDRVLVDLGFDSIGLTNFANAINRKFQVDLTPVLFFDYPSIGEIAKYLSVERESDVRAARPVAPQSAPQSAPEPAGHTVRIAEPILPSSGEDVDPDRPFLNEPVAIVGIAGVMPQSDDLDALWDHLRNAKDLITVIPEDRWNWEEYYGNPLKEANKSNSKWGGFMKEIDKFDPLFFGISPREAQMMDPQQRIFLETVWKAIEDSGQKVSELSGTRTGLFVGVGSNDYIDILRLQADVLDGYTASGNSHAVLANRVSFLLNLRGPSAPIDTACSSSLVALHRAIESIHTRSCDMAIVGGVQVILSPGAYISFGMAGMLSSDGKCKTFDKRANGYVRGEGCGAMFLKPLSLAETDGNHIYAVIRATSENHGGRVTTMTAPNASAQAALLIEAYEKAEVDPTTVGYIECHGTGTSLGDPIEVQALSKAFSELYKRYDIAPATTPHCGLGTIKTNVGHLETAAGIAGLLKVLLALEHKEIPANVHFEELNPYIALGGTPFYVVDKLTPWEGAKDEDGLPVPRRAGVSSFGFGGANAHAVLEEYFPPARAARPAMDAPQLIILSAKNEDRLTAYVRSMQAYLGKSEVELADLAYTLQVGRDEMPERLALVVSNTEDLERKFEEILEGGELPRGCYRNHVANREGTSPSVDDVQSLIEQKDLSQLAERWVSGAKIDWRSIHDSGVPRRISAPTYPFARERYWVPGAKERRQGVIAATLLHPLIHRNVSTLEEQKFASRFSGEEFYFSDHVIGTRKVLPGVACLEMARVAGELSGNANVRVIRNLTWEKPLVMDGDARDVEVSLTPARNEVRFAVRTAAGESLVTHCTGGLRYEIDVAAPESLDLAGIKERCAEQVLSGDDLYASLGDSGLKLGKGFRIVRSIYANESESLAIVQPPEHLGKEADPFLLHPAVMSAALHTAIGLMKKNGMEIPLTQPSSAGEVQILHPLRDLHYVYATWADENRKVDPNDSKVTYHLLDRNGRVLVRIKDVASKPFDHRPSQPRGATPPEEIQAGLHSLSPVWNPVRVEPSARVILPDTSRILVLGSDRSRLDWVRRFYPSSQLLELVAPSTIDSIAKSLGECSFDQLLWVAPDIDRNGQTNDQTNDQTIDQQEEGVLTVFRIIKALLQLGYANKKLQWTFVTGRTQRVTEADPIQPAHAGVIGVVGSLAKEYPQWDLRLLDVDSLASVEAQECLSLPWDKQGNALAHRRGEWFRQGLAFLATPPQVTPVYRQDGVYVVIGGAGGIGEVWSRFMIEHYQANVVWIGRRPYGAAIEEKIHSLASLGCAPTYIPADATSFEALLQARKTILESHPAIHGVVHSAIVLHDQSIARMDESIFRASLSAKVDVSVNMDRVFGGDALDFMLFFSSIISFGKSAGQSNYSAGCTFKDSFAQKLQQQRPHPVKIMNWGYWGNVGIVADESYNKAMAQMGLGSIEPDEGMASLRMLVDSDMRQLALIKTLNRQAAAALNLEETVTHHPPTVAAVLPEVQRILEARVSGERIVALEAGLPTRDMNDLATEVLASSLMSLGLFANGNHRIADLASDKRPAPYYERWLSSSIRYLQQQEFIGENLTVRREVRTLADLWPEWEAKRSAWGTDPSVQAEIALFEACLKALPRVLSGRQLATDVLFPNSSLHLVEGIYRGNAHADHYNAVLVETLVECVEQQLRTDRERRIRILEIGAGTGGTTATLLPVLQRYPVQEYCFTDISKAFLMYAEKCFQPQFPALKTAIFDVSKPLAAQGIAGGHYDFVIAANVLHATPDIRQSVRNAKAALRNHGVLLLNEVSAWALFSHLTFGLLEGWWLYEDTAVRLPGSPGLAPEAWREILAQEGFESMLWPAAGAHQFGQQIIAAEGNGWTRQRMVKHVPAQSPRTLAVASSSAEPAGQTSRAYVRRIITEQLAEALRMDAATIRTDAPLPDYGVDSIIGVNLVRTISEVLQIELETSSLFEYSTVDQLTDYIVTNWQPQIAARATQAQRPDSSPEPRPSIDEAPAAARARPGPVVTAKERFVRRAGRISVEPIAIIGMSGRFAESESLDAFWGNLAQGKDLVKKVSRWKGTDCQGSFVDSIDRFDRAFFGISPEEATSMDPQQRLFLEESWRALEDAGYAGKGVREKRCGVYVGSGSSGYDGLFAEDRPLQSVWGSSECDFPARIARHLELEGPAIAVDTACSSSLVAIHLACQGLWSRDTELALAGGVFLQATPELHQAANRAGMLSPAGKCHSFDARANGFVPGEGVGVIVLKRLEDALDDGDHVHGVIVGSGISHDGSANEAAASSDAQERLERSVYDRFGIDPETIQVVEAHAAGSLRGDSIEYDAITRAFRQSTDKKQFCAIGTVKTNVGHAAAAAGVAGMLKLLLALKHRQIPPSLHFERSNPDIDFGSGPFFVNTQLREWTVEDHQVRRAAISSLGLGGTNAHLVIDEGPSIARAAVENPGYLVVLSARTAEQLKQQARNLLELVGRSPDLSMNDASFSLFLGRLHLTHRLACVARNRDELIRLLERWLETGTASEVYTGEVHEGRTREQVSLKTFGNHCIEECRNETNAGRYLDRLAAIADLYVQGYSLDFHALFSGDSKRIPLPTYPFAGERYWAETGSAPVRTSAAHTNARLHPLLHLNTSTLRQQSYSSTLTGAELFLEDHPLSTNGHAGQKVLPAAVCLEMARAAIEAAAGIPQGSSVVELEDTVWGNPVIVAGNRELTVSLLTGDNEQVDYEIYSGETGRGIVHCQGRIRIIDESAPPPVDIDELRGQMHEVPYGPAHQAITAVHHGDRQLLARLSLPAAVAAIAANNGHGGYLLHPVMATGALQSGMKLAADAAHRPVATLTVQALERLRVLSPCKGEMFAWARQSREAVTEGERIKVDIDLIDARGKVCVQIRGLSFQPASQLHSSGKEAVELFLKQEAALQLRRPLDAIATDRSYFDLGFSSSAISSFLQAIDTLLGENLSPTILFDQRDIQSLAAYLTTTYRSRIDVLAETHPLDLVPLPRKTYFAAALARSSFEETNGTTSDAELGEEEVLANVLWNDAWLDDSYEKLTF